MAGEEGAKPAPAKKGKKAAAAAAGDKPKLAKKEGAKKDGGGKREGGDAAATPAVKRSHKAAEGKAAKQQGVTSSWVGGAGTLCQPGEWR